MTNVRSADRLLHTSVSSFEGVSRLLVQSEALEGKTHLLLRSVLDVTRHHLLRHGAEHEEAAVCWAGTMAGEVALVTTVLRFVTASSHGAVHVTPESSGLLYAHLHARGLTLLAQVHSHPASAFHSLVDERSPHSPERGFLSAVVPYFGDCAFDDFSAWAVFQQVRYEKWRELSREEKRARLHILDTDILVP